MARKSNQSPSAQQRRFASALEFTSLTDAEKADIRARAHAKVEEERKQSEEDQFFEQAMQEARSAYDPTLQMVDVLVDLPGHSVHILVDGLQFMHGQVYEVPKPVADTINEIIYRAWQHEKEIGGANRSFYMEPRNLKLNRHSTNITTSRLMGR